MSQFSDLKDLLQRARNGDADALGRILETLRDRLRNLAEKQLRGRAVSRVDASDVVQQTFLEAHRHFGQFLGQDSPELEAWLGRLLDNTVAKTIRGHSLTQKRDIRREQAPSQPCDSSTTPREEHLGSLTTPSERAMRGEDLQRVTQALACLPEDQRAAVRLRHLEGKSLQQIAEQLGRSVTATAGLIKRGMKALRTHLRPSD